MEPTLNTEDMVFRALADPTRRRILELIGQSELSVKQLTSEFQMTQSAISQHLRVLKEAGLAGERRTGRNRLYRMQADPLRLVEKWVRENADFWATRMENLGTYLRKADAKKD